MKLYGLAILTLFFWKEGSLSQGLILPSSISTMKPFTEHTKTAPPLKLTNPPTLEEPEYKLKWFRDVPFNELLSYKNVFLIKLSDNHHVPTDNQIQFIKNEWNNRIQVFFLSELTPDDPRFKEYFLAQIESFLDYDSIIEPLEKEIKKKFGSKTQIVLGDELIRIREEAWSVFDHRVEAALGKDRFDRLENLRDQFGRWVYKEFQVGWNDAR
ncbi:MAG: hypothetical protein AB7F43_09250 [Bacteriovoracia bacterium]